MMKSKYMIRGLSAVALLALCTGTLAAQEIGPCQPMTAALRDQNKPVRYLRFPREPHGFKEPRHQRTVYVEEVRWIQKYVRGVEWTPWERLGEKAVEEKDVSENPLRRAVNPG